MYYGARFYDSTLGRWVQPDSVIPEALQGTQAWDRFAYANNNAIKYNDPTGHDVGAKGSGGYDCNPTCSNSSGYGYEAHWEMAGASLPVEAAQFYANVVGNDVADYLIAKSPLSGMIMLNYATQEINTIETASAAGDVLTDISLSVLNNASTGLFSAAVGGDVAGINPSIYSSSLDAPNFIGTPNGELIIVPEGATGPSATRGAGFEFTGGSGGHGLDPRVTDVRIMDPTPPRPPSPGYPNGYVSYSNSSGQTVNPFTGQTISPNNPFWHIKLK